jgi:hypothetical protein
MLTAKTIDYTNRIVSVKLVTGEEIIARVVEQKEHSLVFKRPLSMVMMAGDDDNQGQVAFAPWMLGLPDDARVELPRERLVYVGESRKDAAEQYVIAVNDYEGPRAATVEVAGASRGRL